MIRKALIVLIPILFLGALIGWYMKTKIEPAAPVQEPGVFLTNLSSSYCPKNAWLVVVPVDQNKAVFDSRISVTECSLIPFPQGAFSQGANRVLVKLPKALAFEVIVNDVPTVSIEHGVQVGDLTGDNVIDDKDASVLEAALIVPNPSQVSVARADLDHDGKLTVLDLALISLNKGTGQQRPDGAPWGILE